MPLRRYAGSSAQAYPAFTPGYARSRSDRAGPRRTPSCAGTSAASSQPSTGSTAHQSMSRRGNCLDNAPMESFFASLKTERVHQAQFRTRAEARAAVFEYIEVFYNRQRLHSALGYRTPAEARASMEAVTMRAAA